jgi:phage shock protein E
MKAILIILASILIIYIGYRTYRFATISDGLAAKIANGAIILDVRTAEEYKMGHIDGAVNISLGTIRERYKELDTTKMYITTCSHGLRSVKAESLLKERGFKNVYNGGAWTDLQEIVKRQKGEK